MALLKKFLQSERKEMVENNIRLRVIGQLDRLPAKVRQTLDQTMTATRELTGMNLILALSYGGRAEIVRMVQEVAEKIKRGIIEPQAVNEELISDHLYTRDIP